MTTDQTKATIQDVVDAIDRQTQMFIASSQEAAAEYRLLREEQMRTLATQQEGLAMARQIIAAACADATQNPAQEGENAPLADAGHYQAPEHPQPAPDAPEPAQTLADLTPCLGDRVRVPELGCGSSILTFRWSRDAGGYYCWSRAHWDVFDGSGLTVLEHLDPVTPEEPPVGAGMLVDDAINVLFRRFDEGWCWINNYGKWCNPCDWESLTRNRRLRPATPADLAEHGVDEQGEPVGKGEADEVTDLLAALQASIDRAKAKRAEREAGDRG